MEDLEVWIQGFLITGAFAWLAWETRTRYAERRETWTRMNEIETRITVLETVDTLTYRQFVAELDKRITPIQETLNAIAVVEKVKPERRKS